VSIIRGESIPYTISAKVIPSLLAYPLKGLFEGFRDGGENNIKLRLEGREYSCIAKAIIALEGVRIGHTYIINKVQ
jgi:hypothetical protein